MQRRRKSWQMRSTLALVVALLAPAAAFQAPALRPSLRPAALHAAPARSAIAATHMRLGVPPPAALAPPALAFLTGRPRGALVAVVFAVRISPRSCGAAATRAAAIAPAPASEPAGTCRRWTRRRRSRGGERAAGEEADRRGRDEQGDREADRRLRHRGGAEYPNRDGLSASRSSRPIRRPGWPGGDLQGGDARRLDLIHAAVRHEASRVDDVGHRRRRRRAHRRRLQADGERRRHHQRGVCPRGRPGLAVPGFLRKTVTKIVVGAAALAQKYLERNEIIYARVVATSLLTARPFDGCSSVSGPRPSRRLAALMCVCDWSAEGEHAAAAAAHPAIRHQRAASTARAPLQTPRAGCRP